MANIIMALYSSGNQHKLIQHNVGEHNWMSCNTSFTSQFPHCILL